MLIGIRNYWKLKRRIQTGKKFVLNSFFCEYSIDTDFSWRHSGYKSLYIDDASSSPSPVRRSRSRSQTGLRSPRSPPIRRSPVGRRSPRSPPPRRSSVNRRSPVSRRSPINHRSLVSRRSPPPVNRSRVAKPRSPRPTKAKRSPSASSVSSCSDDSCSVCSPKNRRARSRQIPNNF